MRAWGWRWAARSGRAGALCICAICITNDFDRDPAQEIMCCHDRLHGTMKGVSCGYLSVSSAASHGSLPTRSTKRNKQRNRPKRAGQQALQGARNQRGWRPIALRRPLRAERCDPPQCISGGSIQAGPDGSGGPVLLAAQCGGPRIESEAEQSAWCREEALHVPAGRSWRRMRRPFNTRMV